MVFERVVWEKQWRAAGCWEQWRLDRRETMYAIPASRLPVLCSGNSGPLERYAGR
jgi:hypothetical protein